jgi:hypothetical protein
MVRSTSSAAYPASSRLTTIGVVDHPSVPPKTRRATHPSRCTNRKRRGAPSSNVELAPRTPGTIRAASPGGCEYWKMLADLVNFDRLAELAQKVGANYLFVGRIESLNVPSGGGAAVTTSVRIQAFDAAAKSILGLRRGPAFPGRPVPKMQRSERRCINRMRPTPARRGGERVAVTGDKPHAPVPQHGDHAEPVPLRLVRPVWRAHQCSSLVHKHRRRCLRKRSGPA